CESQLAVSQTSPQPLRDSRCGTAVQGNVHSRNDLADRDDTVAVRITDGTCRKRHAVERNAHHDDDFIDGHPTIAVTVARAHRRWHEAQDAVIVRRGRTAAVAIAGADIERPIRSLDHVAQAAVYAVEQPLDGADVAGVVEDDTLQVPRAEAGEEEISTPGRNPRRSVE